MADAAQAPKEFSPEIKALGDQLVKLTLKEAVDLADYLKQAHGVEPASGGAIMMAAAPGAGAPAPAEEKTTFDVILANAGER